MGSTRKVRCPICEQKTYFKDRDSLISHIGKKHKESIPEGWQASRYENYLRTGKTAGSCMVCKKETGWNESTNKYHRICKNPACKKVLADQAEANMVKKTGMTRSERLSRPDVQVKMIYAKHTSGCIKVDGKEIWYDSSFGKDFVEMLNGFLNFDMSDVSGPSPNTYEYTFEGKKHIYIPDFHIYTLGIEVECKDGGDNPNNHPKIQQVDKKKEAEKDKVMEKLQKEGKLHYIKIVNKDYRGFFELLMRLKEQYDGDTTKPQGGAVKESMEFVEESVTPSDLAQIFNLNKAVRGKTSSYAQIPKFYMSKIENMEAKDAAFWEERVTLTTEALEAKQQTDKSYALERCISEMKTVIIPALNRKMEELRRKNNG